MAGSQCSRGESSMDTLAPSKESKGSREQRRPTRRPRSSRAMLSSIGASTSGNAEARADVDVWLDGNAEIRRNRDPEFVHVDAEFAVSGKSGALGGFVVGNGHGPCLSVQHNHGARIAFDLLSGHRQAHGTSRDRPRCRGGLWHLQVLLLPMAVTPADAR